MVNKANVAHFTNTWYPSGKLKPFKSTLKKCEEYWDDLVQAFGVQKNPLSISHRDKAGIEICCKEFGFIVEQWFESTNIGPKSNAWSISIGKAKGRNLTDFSILVICNFRQFYFYDPETDKHYGPIEGNAIVNNIPVIKSLFGKWAKRFNVSLNFESFDGINDGNLQKRWKGLKKRIARYRGPSRPSLSPAVLAWNKNPQCLPTWESIQVRPDVSSERCGRSYERWKRNNKDGDLVLMRHMYWEVTLKYATYFDSYFSDISKDAEEDIYSYSFWLINKGEADFAYAILKSSMFKAWCELTAYTGKWKDKKGHNHQGDGHFAVGMWNTFPIQNTTTPLSKLSNRYMANMFQREGGAMTVEGAISCAGRWLSRNVWKQHSPTLSFDECMDELCGFGPVPTSLRKQILAKGFLDAFYGA